MLSSERARKDEYRKCSTDSQLMALNDIDKECGDRHRNRGHSPNEREANGIHTSWPRQLVPGGFELSLAIPLISHFSSISRASSTR